MVNPPPAASCACYTTRSTVRLIDWKSASLGLGHQRGMGGRKTGDDGTLERHTDTQTHKHSASWLPHTLSWRTHCHILPVVSPSQVARQTLGLWERTQELAPLTCVTSHTEVFIPRSRARPWHWPDTHAPLDAVHTTPVDRAS